MNPRDANPTILAIDLPAVHLSVRMGRRLVQTFAQTAEIADKEIDCLMLVASELLANAADHGGGGGAMLVEDLAKDVRMGLKLSWDGATWTLSVEDGGAGDLAEAQASIESEPVDVLAALESERGRGLFLVRDMCDRLEVHQGEYGLVFVAEKTL